MAELPSLVLLSGAAAPVTALRGESVGELRSRLAAAEGVPGEFVALLAGDAELSDDRPVERLTEAGVAQVQVVVDGAALVDTFDDFNLSGDLLRGIRAYGLQRPSPLQKQAVSHLVSGRDVLAQAPSGTGKTAAYVIAALQRTDLQLAATQTVVLAPTRELACPIQGVACALGAHMRLSSQACVGGGGALVEDARLREGVHFVVGTPGRMHDVITRRLLRLEDLKAFVLDEMDEMMSRGFKGLIFETMELLPPSVQLAVFGATMPPELLDYMKQSLRDPKLVRVKKDELTLGAVRQFYVFVDQEEWKLDAFCDLLEALTVAQAIVYCNTRRKVDFLADQVLKRDFAVTTMHADVHDPESTMSEFSSGSSRILISTDVLASGVKIPEVPLVINYDLPPNMECYLHRLGRSGKSSRNIIAISFVTAITVRLMKDIESYYQTQVEEMPLEIADLI